MSSRARIGWSAAFVGIALAATAAVSSTASAQSYPARPVKVLVPFPPGGSNDVAGRILAAQLTEKLGQSFYVENRGGAGGTVGSDVIAKSPADGYNLLLISSAYPVSGSLYKLPYDPKTAFTPVGRFASGPGVLIVNPAIGANTLKDFIALAKAKPGQLNFSSAGVGSFEHLSEALFKLQAKADVVIVQYKGGGPALADLLANQVQAQIGSLIQTTQYIKSGQLKALGTTGSKRVAALPDVPTIAEAGVPGFEALNWWGIIAPVGTPAPIVKQLHDTIDGIMAAPATKERFASIGAEPATMGIKEFGDYIDKETVRWAKIVKDANIHVE
jgi:tripartite-type tricarboxylate transporter receptor subunit TctC